MKCIQNLSSQANGDNEEDAALEQDTALIEETRYVSRENGLSKKMAQDEHEALHTKS